MSIEGLNNSGQDKDLDSLRAEFFSREGGVGFEVSQKEAIEWGRKMLDTLSYPNEESKKNAHDRLWMMLVNDYEKWADYENRDTFTQHTAVIHEYVGVDEYPTPLDVTERFIRVEKERLEGSV